MARTETRTDRSTVRPRRGGAALEFAFVLPVLVLLTLPVADFTWYFLSLQHVHEAAVSGVRTGVRMSLDEGPDTTAVSAASDALAVSMPWASSSASMSSTIIDPDILRLEIKVPFTPLAGYVATPPDLHVAYKMRIEDP